MKEKRQENVGVEAVVAKKEERKTWQKPTLEDVSEKIMAQPYIRFT